MTFVCMCLRFSKVLRDSSLVKNESSSCWLCMRNNDITIERGLRLNAFQQSLFRGFRLPFRAGLSNCPRNNTGYNISMSGTSAGNGKLNRIYCRINLCFFSSHWGGTK